MRTLYLFTCEFPYGKIENFLEIEIEYLCARFERVVIVPISGSEKTMRAVPTNCCVLKPIRHGKRNAILNGFSFRRFPFFAGEFVRNKVWKKRSRIRSFINAMVNVNNYLHSSQIKEILRTVNLEDIFYSYWGKVGTDLWPFVKGKARLVSRFHGDWDLWGTCDDYAPFRSQVAGVIDIAAFISSKGREYFINRWRVDNAYVFPLGTINDGFVSSRSKDGVLRIVSCSAIYPVKRVDLIFRALQLIDDRKVEWTHIGGGRGGIETDDVVKLRMSVSQSRPNIKITLTGAMTNAEVLEFYKNNPVDLFINVSRIEGVPVSIMEAISYDIPVVATDVGATSEVVTPDCGVLISSNPSDEEVKNAILKVSSSSFHAKEHWNKHYNAEINYSAWAQFLFNL